MRPHPRQSPPRRRATARTVLSSVLACALMLFVVLPHLAVMAVPANPGAEAAMLAGPQTAPCHAKSGDDRSTPKRESRPVDAGSCCSWNCGWLGPVAETVETGVTPTAPPLAVPGYERLRGIAVEPGERPPRMDAGSVFALNSPGAAPDGRALRYRDF